MFRKAKRFRKKEILIWYLTDFMTMSMQGRRTLADILSADKKSALVG